MLMLLSGAKWYSRQELMERFEISERTVYRYLDEIRDCGFIIENNFDKYRLIQENGRTKDLKKLIHFDEQEISIFYKAIMELKDSEIFAKNLIRKLHVLYDFKMLKEKGEHDILALINQLGVAIQERKQVVLKDYRSSNSEEITDREVEPFGFGKEYLTVKCLDRKDKKVKQFKITRIGSVETLTNNWFYEELHTEQFTDAFRMSADTAIDRVELQMTLTAYNLLKEEFPLCNDYIASLNNGHYLLSIDIADYKGVGRYVLGLPGEIEVLGSISFQNYLKNKIKQYAH
ncbi:MAG TPA: WYL domain-containing protein [Edaphocola sp.]|nr:WYL domain-containing protein [Edaphocola sp.]